MGTISLFSGIYFESMPHYSSRSIISTAARLFIVLLGLDPYGRYLHNERVEYKVLLEYCRDFRSIGRISCEVQPEFKTKHG